MIQYAGESRQLSTIHSVDIKTKVMLYVASVLVYLLKCTKL